MRTTLDLDGSLLKRLVKETGSRSKTQALETAAREYLKMLDRRRIIDNFGKVAVAEDAAEYRKRDRRQ